MKKISKALTSGSVVVLLAVGGIAAGTAASASIPALTGTQVPQDLPSPSYEVNERGLTFGSAAEARTPDEEPDLVLVVATNGKEGYALSTDLLGPVPSSPEEALRLANEAKPRSIPVFAPDGLTQIGEFVVAVSTASVEKAPAE